MTDPSRFVLGAVANEILTAARAAGMAEQDFARRRHQGIGLARPDHDARRAKLARDADRSRPEGAALGR